MDCDHAVDAVLQSAAQQLAAAASCLVVRDHTSDVAVRRLIVCPQSQSMQSSRRCNQMNLSVDAVVTQCQRNPKPRRCPTPRRMCPDPEWSMHCDHAVDAVRRCVAPCRVVAPRRLRT